MSVRVTRLALTYTPHVTLALELTLASSHPTHYELAIPLRPIALDPRTRLENLQQLDVADLWTTRLVARYPHVLSESQVSHAQVRRLMLLVLAQGVLTDLNRADERALTQVKQIMDESFHDKLIRPDDPAFVYDKQVEFEEATEASEWD